MMIWQSLTVVQRSPVFHARSLCDAPHEAQMAILSESVIRLSPDAFDAFVAAIEAAPSAPPPKVAERLQRKAPWEN
ncbi:type II toxin -antitoxin system TacA 1-like antitoxin [Rhizobium pisi]|uniref:type II toxin -antitoxin system TacA 1-like antitoxin n=1 Tax=Rhizobium TaxID=379 RepID=UPI003D061D2F